MAIISEDDFMAPAPKKSSSYNVIPEDDFMAPAPEPVPQQAPVDVASKILGPQEESDSSITKGFKRLGYGLDYAKNMTAQDFPGAARSIAESAAYERANPSSKEAQELSAAYEGGDGFWGGVAATAGEMYKDIKQAPSITDAILETGKNVKALAGGVVSQMPNMLAPMGGMVAGAAAGSAVYPVIGTAVGGWGGASAGNTLVEGQGIAMNALIDAGIDPSDEKSVTSFLEKNSASLFGKAATKGSIIGLVDTISAGIVGKILTAPARAAARRTLTDMGVDLTNKAAVKTAMESKEFAAKYVADKGLQASQKSLNKFLRNSGAAAMEPAGEFTGEFVGSGVAEGKWDVKEAGLEALSSIGQSTATFIGGKVYEAATDPLKGKGDKKQIQSQANQVRNEAVLAIKEANLPTEDLAKMRRNPDILKSFGINEADLNAIIVERQDHLKNAAQIILESGESGPLSRSASIKVGTELQLLDAANTVSKEKERMDKTRGRYQESIPWAEVVGEDKSLDDLVNEVQQDIDWQQQSRESELYKKQSNLKEEEDLGNPLPPRFDPEVRRKELITKAKTEELSPAENTELRELSAPRSKGENVQDTLEITTPSVRDDSGMVESDTGPGGRTQVPGLSDSRASAEDTQETPVTKQSADNQEAGRDQEELQRPEQTVVANESTTNQVEAQKTEKTSDKSQHDYSNTQVSLAGPTAEKVKSIGQSIPEEELYVDPNDSSYGREENPHVTVRYGLETDDPADVAELSTLAPFKGKIGKISIFEGEKYDVVKADVESDGLHAANKKVGDLAPVPGETFTDYQPHVTIAYVKKGEGAKYVGNAALEGQEIEISSIDLADRNGNTHTIQLTGKTEDISGKPKAPETGEIKTQSRTETQEATQEGVADSGTPQGATGFAGNKVFTSARVEKARKRLAEVRGTLSAGFNPESLVDVATIGGAHFEKGLREFAQWSAQMVKDFGEKIKPHLKKIYDDLKNHKAFKETAKQEDNQGIIVGTRPGEFDWAIDNEEALPPIQHPVSGEPRPEKMAKSIAKIFRSKGFKDLAKDFFGIDDISATQVAGSWLGTPEKSFVLTGASLTPEQADNLANLMGWAFAQEGVITSYIGTEKRGSGYPTAYIGNNSRLTKKQIDAIVKESKNQGIDYTSTLDGKGVKYLDMDGDENFYQKVLAIKEAAGLQHFHETLSRTEYHGSTTYLSRGKQATGSGSWSDTASGRPSVAFRRAVDHLLVPYAKATAAEGYRFSPERFAERFGHSEEQVKYITSALRQGNWRKRSTVDILKGKEKPDHVHTITKTGKNKGQMRAKVTDVLWYLQNRAAQFGLIEPGDYSKEAKRTIANAMADEVVYHLEANDGKSAIGWYDRALKKAMGIYHEMFPELETDMDAKLVFEAILGITSHGSDVFTNSSNTAKVYSIYRETKDIRPAVKKLKGKFGKETNGVENNLLKLQHLLDVNGIDRMRKLFNRKRPAADWNKTLREDKSLYGPDGKPLQLQMAAHMKGNGWFVFGPKIGSFINNLHGDYSTLTADLWFTRTFNRLIGYAFNHSPELERTQYNRFKEAIIGEMNGDPGHNDLAGMSEQEIEEALADPETMLNMAADIDTAFRKSEYKDKSELRNAAKRWIDNRKVAAAAPRGLGERAFQQETVEAAAKIIKRRTGLDITIADVQAALWYHEKNLFKFLGNSSKRSEAADYVDAAVATREKFFKGKLTDAKPKQKEQTVKYSFGAQESGATESGSPALAGQGDLRSGKVSDAGYPITEEGEAKLIHWSGIEGLTSLDPSKHGTGISGAESKRKNEDPENWVDRTYYAIQGGGYTKEPGLGSYQYTTNIPAKNLYDITADPDGFIGKAKTIVAENPFANLINVTEKLISENGYIGYTSNRMGHVAAVFDVMPVAPMTEEINSPADQDPKFSVMENYSPKKTVKAYKLFRIDPNFPGELFPLFVDAKNPVPVGEWLEATDGGGYYFTADNGLDYVPATTGGSIAIPNDKIKRELLKRGLISSMDTKNIKCVARRPGWHAGDSPIAPHIGGKTKGATKPDYRPDNHVWAEVEMPADKDWQTEADSRARISKKGEPVASTAHIVDEIPFDGYYRYKTNSNMVGNWMISGQVKVIRVLSDKEVSNINKAAGVKDLPRRSGFTFDVERHNQANKLDSIEQEIAAVIGEEGLQNILAKGTVNLLDTQEEAKALIDKSSKKSVRYSKNGKIQGFITGDKIYLVKDGIAKGQAFPVLKHELGVHLRKLTLTDPEFQAILKSLKDRQNETGGTGKAIRAAMARVPRNTKPEYYWEEVLAYMVESHPKHSLVKRFIAKIKEILSKIGLDVKTLTVGDLNALALAAIHQEASSETVSENSPEFKAWFKDSKIVDKNGKPLLVKHGTPVSDTRNFAFEFDRIGTNGRAEGTGFYFTTNDRVASGYGHGGTVLEGYLSIQKPLAYDTPPFTGKTLRQILKRAAELEAKEDEMDIEDGFLSNYGDIRYEGMNSVLRSAAQLLESEETALDQMGGIVGSGVNPKNINEAVRDITGYDGVKVQGFSNSGDKNTDIYVAFFPEQFKAKDNNTFDPKNPDIYKSSTGPVFHSRLQNMIEDKAPKSATPKKWMETIDQWKKKGTMPAPVVEELEWSGLEEFLQSFEEFDVSDLNPVEIDTYNYNKGKRTVSVQKKWAISNPFGHFAVTPEFKTKQEAQEWLDKRRDDIVKDFLAEKDFNFHTGIKVSRADVLAFLSENSVQVGEKFLSGGRDAEAAWEDATSEEVLAAYMEMTGQTEEEVQWVTEGDMISELSMNNFLDDVRDPDNPGTQFDDYQLPGGDNYQEMLITLPGKAEGNEYRSGHFDTPNVLAHVRFNERIDSDGKRVLFLEEVQSDWHQTGRSKGYRTKEKKANKPVIEDLNVLLEMSKMEELGDRFNETEKESDWDAYEKATRDLEANLTKSLKDAGLEEYSFRHMAGGWVIIKKSPNGGGVNATKESETPQEAYNDLVLGEDMLTRFGIDSNMEKGVPDAPFKKSWPMLAMKRMIRYAAENGFDRIAWTTGEQQAERYDLSRQIDSVASGYNDITKEYTLKVEDKNGRTTTYGHLKEENLEDYVGKELAEKIVNGQENIIERFTVASIDGKWQVFQGEKKIGLPYNRSADAHKAMMNENHKLPPGGVRKMFSGLDLKVGGEGMKAFYNKMLPSQTNKLIKKFGSKVGVIDLGNENRDAYYVGEPNDIGEIPVIVTHSGVEMRSFIDRDQAKEYADRLNEENRKFVTEKSADKRVSKQLGFDVTDMMKASAVGQGMPLFSKNEFSFVTKEMLNTPEFKKWFGTSKIKNKKGKPITVYHGSPERFFVFDNEKLGQNTESPLTGLGHFFALSPAEARGYAGPGGVTSEYYVKVENPLVIDSWLLPTFDSSLEARAYAKRQKELNGYDGIYLKDHGHLIAFDSIQVKSAEVNTGEFSTTNSDVRYSIANDEAAEVREMLENVLGAAATRRTLSRTKKTAVPKDTGEKVLEKSRTATGNISKAKVIKRFQGYEELVAAINNDREDVTEKQRLLGLYINQFDREVRGTYGLSGVPARLSSAKSDATRQRILHEALMKINRAHEDYVKKGALAELAKIIKANAPKLKGSIAKQTSGGFDLFAELRAIREVIRMKPDSIEAAIEYLTNDVETSKRVDAEMTRTPLKPGQTREDQRDEIMQKIDRENLLQIRRLSIYGGLRQGSAEDALNALEAIKETVSGKKAAWIIEMEELSVQRQADRIKAVNVITGMKGLKTQEQRQLDKVEDDKTTKRILDSMRGFDDKHQSWEWLLDKFSRFDKGSKILGSFLVKRFGSMVGKATRAEQQGLRKVMFQIQQKREEIYGVTGKALEKRATADAARVVESGVWTRTPTGAKRSQLALSQTEAYKRWMEMQDPSLQEQLLEQGYDYETLKELEAFMTPETRAWAEWQLTEFYPGYYGSVNETFKKLFYTDMPFNKSYSPIRRRYPKGREDSQLLTNVNPHSSVVAGGVKNRVANTREILLQDGDAVLIQHIQAMEHFKAWGETMRELRAVIGSEQVRMAIRDFHGKTGLDVLDTFLDDLARNRGGNDVEAGMLMHFRSAFATAVIGLNPIVFIKQLTSIPAYALDMPAAEWVKNFPNTLGKVKKAYAVLKESEMLKARYEEGFERDMVLAMSRSQAGKLSGTKKLAGKLMILTKMGDGIAIIMGGWPVYQYAHKMAMQEGKTKEEADAIAMAAFEDATDRTQQAGNLKDMMHYQRGGPWIRMFTMFMTSPASYYRQWSGAIRHLLGSGHDKRDAAKRLVISHLVLPALFQFVASGFRAPWDDDDWLKTVALGPINGVIFMRDIVTSLVNKALGQYTYGKAGQAPMFSTVDEAEQFIGQVRTMINKPTDEWMTDSTFWDVVISGGTVAGNLTGVPFGPAQRWASGVIDAATGDTTAPIRRAIGYSEKKIDMSIGDYREIKKEIRAGGQGSVGYQQLKMTEKKLKILKKRKEEIAKDGSRAEMRNINNQMKKVREDFVARFEYAY